MPPTPEPVNRCYKCGEELHFEVKIGRRDMCPNCYAYLHCCRNCQHWDASVHNQCLEERSEFIRDREEGNFCLYFTFKDVGGEDESEEAKAKEKLKKLFGVSVDKVVHAPKTEDEAKKKLEALFKKPGKPGKK
jgi:hypothetical protein